MIIAIVMMNVILGSIGVYLYAKNGEPHHIGWATFFFTMALIIEMKVAQ
jgi:hypothetical protein